ncbi:MAG: TlpA family protein disulfide reductase [Prevotellaceae bacterium]|nr:TlpA family protein disulfide reductase [Prevotellaceae bacterium]
MNKSPMLILAIAALSVTACNGNTNEKKDTAENTPTEIADIMEEPDDEMSTSGIVIGSAYKDFTLKTPDGEEKSLSELIQGHKLVLVDFWASWCSPCRQEMPNVVAVYEEFKPFGLEIVGVSFDTDIDSWKSAIKKLGITWPQISDLNGWDSAAGRLYDVNSIPCTMLINDKGIIVAKDLRGDKLREKIAELIK